MAPTLDDVGLFVVKVARVWLSDPLRVELRERATSCPFKATVWREGGSWWVLADVDYEPADLLRALLHEVAHAALGHVDRVDSPGRGAVVRSVMDGNAGERWSSGVAAECKATTTRKGQQLEAEADDWASSRFKWLWGTLCDWGDPVAASKSVWWVRQNWKGDL